MKKKISRQAVMRAYGEYLDYCQWLAEAKAGISVFDDDPSISELAQSVCSANLRAEEKMSAYLDQFRKEDAD